jgi:hypothetical protein
MVGVYHFNIQYVAGGLAGFPDGTANDQFNFDEPATEDLIVKQGLEPLLDLMIAEPDFHADVEMQSYMLEVIAARHPDVLSKLKQVVASGQADVDSFHYSDQLFVAYPAVDLIRSNELTEAVFQRACLPRGGSIFTQEGQFARGELPIARDHGFKAAMLPKNLFIDQFGQAAADRWALYADPAVPEVPVIIAGQTFHIADGAPGGPFDLAWLFMNDGELALSHNKLDPYFGTEYVPDPQVIASTRDQIHQLVASGYTFATVREAVQSMIARGISPQPLPPVIDGTWQPKDTDNLFRWIGGGGLFRSFESDSETLAAIWRARRKIEYAERAIPSPGPDASRGIRAAWREVLLAEGSDVTGWNPWAGEVVYGTTHARRAEAIADAVLSCAAVPAPPDSVPGCDGGAPVSLDRLGLAVVGTTRNPTISARQCGEGAPAGLFQIDLSLPKTSDKEPTEDPTMDASLERDMELRFTRGGDLGSVGLVEALREDPTELSFGDYSFSETGVPLSAGLIGLGNGRWAILDQSTMRLAATITSSGADHSVVRFRDQTAPRARQLARRLYVLEGADAVSAAGVAARINRPSP